MAEAALNGPQLGACPRAVCAHQSGGSANQGPQKEVYRSSGFEEGEGITVLFQIVGCAVFCLDPMVSVCFISIDLIFWGFHV